jgi:hypothetical protein
MNKHLSSRSRLLATMALLPALAVADIGPDRDLLPIFDAHIHYSEDVWQAIPPQDAIRRLREVGVVRALVSSSGDDGTQALYQADPKLVIPVLRPYRKRGTTRSWMHDETVLPYLQDRLAQYHYAGIGEFHLEGAEADLPVVRQVVQLARQHGLMLHVHSDADAIRRLFAQDPDARILWAHAGFEYAYMVRELMAQQPNLWADLSFRREIFNNGRFLPDWRELLTEHADRFLLGVDTYTPQRWLQLQQVMDWQRELLASLPREAAWQIAYENGQRLWGEGFKRPTP